MCFEAFAKHALPQVVSECMALAEKPPQAFHRRSFWITKKGARLANPCANARPWERGAVNEAGFERGAWKLRPNGVPAMLLAEMLFRKIEVQMSLL